MPRKPETRSRHPRPRAAGSAPRSNSRRSVPQPRPEPPTFWQCLTCGAAVEPEFASADDSWCPSCHATGTVVGMAGQYPSPSLYGAWVARRDREHERKQTGAQLAELLRLHCSTSKEEPMKRTKTHTGTFHCPTCFTEVELVAEPSLKCDTCKGPLAPGSLDEIWADEADDEAE